MTYAIESFIDFCDTMTIAEEGLNIGNRIMEMIERVIHFIKRLLLGINKRPYIYLQPEQNQVLTNLMNYVGSQILKFDKEVKESESQTFAPDKSLYENSTKMLNQFKQAAEEAGKNINQKDASKIKNDNGSNVAGIYKGFKVVQVKTSVITNLLRLLDARMMSYKKIMYRVSRKAMDKNNENAAERAVTAVTLQKVVGFVNSAIVGLNQFLALASKNGAVMKKIKGAINTGKITERDLAFPAAFLKEVSEEVERTVMED